MKYVKICKYLKLYIMPMLLVVSLANAEDIAEQNIVTDNLPAYYPAQFEQVRVINTINSGKNFLEADALHFSIWNNAKVHLLKTEFGNLVDLKPGMVIGFTIKQFGDTSYINEIWELPEEMAPPPQ
ncbi:hypothetical protein H0A36_08985 [Endozoicomonas sp. SM1973]|uniref:Copper-binding protein n=1 Tax=Spartinivicinus marinus TaxID=2994442 RepID=A0A853IF81_9GAMM|nr:hypothetical protein [Spartinivicinus marinus]MCX4027133.1 hypothetical protein [Spartinivicinus marinus]NYZ66146.1 hypothetical protein [Spartinivicinus marinus]